MSIDNYGELKTAVANWLEDSTLDSRIPEFIQLAENRIFQNPHFRVRAMEASSDITISAQTASLPSGFLGVRRFYIVVSANDVRRLDFYPPHEFWPRRFADQNARPEVFTIEGENFVFGPYPDSSSYTGKLLYWKRLDALSSDSDTNWIFTNAVGLYLYGALIEAAPFLEDDMRTLTWSALFDDAMERAVAADKRDRYPAGELQVRTSVPIK